MTPTKNSVLRAALVAVATGAVLSAGIATAQARVFLDVGIGLPGVVVAPAPVAVAPPVVAYAPPPAPPPPVAYAAPTVAAPVGYVWVPGVWGWVGGRYVWAAGHYAMPPWRGAVWRAGYWFHGPHGWAWRGGRWR